MHHFRRLRAGQLLIQTVELERESVVIEPQLMQNGRVHIADGIQEQIEPVLAECGTNPALLQLLDQVGISPIQVPIRVKQ